MEKGMLEIHLKAVIREPIHWKLRELRKTVHGRDTTGRKGRWKHT